mgnify:CR=1 FL=1
MKIKSAKLITLPNKKINPSWFLNLSLKINNNKKIIIAETVLILYESTMLSFKTESSKKFSTNKCVINTIVVIKNNLIKKLERIGLIKN